MKTKQQQALQGLTAQIIGIQYAIKGIADEGGKTNRAGEQRVENLCFAAELLNEAAESLNQVTGV